MRYRTFRNFRKLRRQVSLCVVAAGVFILVGGAALAETAGGEVCADCHEMAAADFNASFHARVWGGAHDCQSCHGPTDQHLDDPSQQNIVSFTKGSGRTAQDLSAKCLECHAGTKKLIYWDMGQHTANDVPCTACHTVHAQRSTVNQPTICFTCHREIKAQISKQSRHPILEGKVKCSDCHNPHGTLSQAMIAAENPNLLCYTCHVDKRGPFIWVHPPAEENCLICHTPHGSRHENLFAERINVLCQDCHDDTFHHGAAYDGTSGFGGAKQSNRFVARGCVECHHTMHGSANFQRSFSR